MLQGDIINLGKHKLMCGDATKKSDVLRLVDDANIDLVLTDPPYGINIQRNTGSVGNDKPRWMNGKGGRRLITVRKYPKLIGDNNQDAARLNYQITSKLCDKQIIWGGQYFANFLPVSGGWLFWDKQMGDNDFSDGEMAYRSWGLQVKKYTHLWNGCCRAGSYFYNGRTRVHPTQKPVELFAQILLDFSNENDIILDSFGGSGTTLLACELTGRKCLMMELSVGYCEIIIQRFNTLTQQLKINI